MWINNKQQETVKPAAQKVNEKSVGFPTTSDGIAWENSLLRLKYFVAKVDQTYSSWLKR